MRPPPGGWDPMPCRRASPNCFRWRSRTPNCRRRARDPGRRRIKTAEEIATLRESVRVAEVGLAAGLASLEAGASVQDLTAVVLEAMTAGGVSTRPTGTRVGDRLGSPVAESARRRPGAGRRPGGVRLRGARPWLYRRGRSHLAVGDVTAGLAPCSSARCSARSADWGLPSRRGQRRAARRVRGCRRSASGGPGGARAGRRVRFPGRLTAARGDRRRGAAGAGHGARGDRLRIRSRESAPSSGATWC